MYFQKSAMNAYATVFAGVNVQGCLYHLLQNIYRHVRSLDLQERYQSDAEFALQVRMVAALAFVPVADVVNSFKELQDKVQSDLTPVLDYFEDNYIGRKRRRVRANSPFAHAVWNVHERAEQEQLVRTTLPIAQCARERPTGILHSRQPTTAV